ncbi:MAG: class I SAM-dependent methyltransferase [Myxococcota bacterium]
MGSMNGHSHQQEVTRGERFEFGKNWQHFLSVLDEDRIRVAERSVLDLLRRDSLANTRFLDIGSGSGLFSLAARRLGASVTSFDYDPASVACTQELRSRYFPNDQSWRVLEGSVLDESFVRSLGSFDVVYSWGVLHHTGDMWRALDLARVPVAANGQLVVAIYNDQGLPSQLWRAVKVTYNRSPVPVRGVVLAAALAYFESQASVARLLRGENPLPFWRSRTYGAKRGMSAWHDVVDWVGGYPFEVARPEAIFDFFRARGFTLERLKTCGGKLGCNEFAFRRSAGSVAPTPE